MDDFQTFKQLLTVVQRKCNYDDNNTWFEGPQTYLDAVKNEIDEVSEELSKSRHCYIEDELGDVLWGFLNTVAALEKTHDVNLDSVISRAFNKYNQRISAIENNEPWDEVKKSQKRALEEEYKKEK
ncbi:nucleotide pyrophosphohydrolase [Veronia nyctiphanis]|uniref:Nucleotide pyrophosphohydrolase n=1 Tax=Veronia nyctiphanis TaxID=1278244 RepID=A0A4Q0YL64_9GAMM|nr:MazG nucleotide pyrophosphohydrolase domain-containing protein [Veronia nyctiphanis]RXJ71512.1 nucleotide pyrophosphohydrolase [Veronia nyctiphanis]